MFGPGCDWKKFFKRVRNDDVMSVLEQMQSKNLYISRIEGH